MSSPAETTLVLDRHTRRYGDGRLLVGLRSGRVLRLSPAGRDALDGLLQRGSTVLPGTARLAERVVDAGLAHVRPPPTATSPDVTVIVPVRDRTASLNRVLEAVGPQFPVIVVDDGSRLADAVAEVCARHGAARLRLARSLGPAAARNAGVREAETAYVALVDSDCLPPPGWIETLAAHMADPIVAAVAPRIVPGPGPAGALQRYALARCPLDMGEEPSLVGPGRPVAYVPTAALLVRREAAENGFDEDLRYGEDVDAVWRWCDVGWQVRYDPAVWVQHHEPATWGALLKRRFRYGTSAAPLARRHPGRLPPLTLSPWAAFAAGAVFAARPRLAFASATWGALRLSRQLRERGVTQTLVVRWTARSLAQATERTGRAATMLAAPALAAALLHCGTRRSALLLVTVPPLSTWSGRARALDPLRWVVASVVDDVAYGAGVWAGSARERAIDALVPRLTRRAPTAPQHRRTAEQR